MLTGDALSDDALAASGLVSEELREEDNATKTRTALVGLDEGETAAPGLPYDPEDPLRGWRDPTADAQKDAEIEAEIQAELNTPPTPIEVVRDPLESLDTGRSVALPGLIAVALAAIAAALWLSFGRGVGNPAEHGVPQPTDTVATETISPTATVEPTSTETEPGQTVVVETFTQAPTG